MARHLPEGWESLLSLNALGGARRYRLLLQCSLNEWKRWNTTKSSKWITFLCFCVAEGGSRADIHEAGADREGVLRGGVQRNRQQDPAGRCHQDYRSRRSRRWDRRHSAGNHGFIAMWLNFCHQIFWILPQGTLIFRFRTINHVICTLTNIYLTSEIFFAIFLKRFKLNFPLKKIFLRNTIWLGVTKFHGNTMSLNIKPKNAFFPSFFLLTQI